MCQPVVLMIFAETGSVIDLVFIVSVNGLVLHQAGDDDSINAERNRYNITIKQENMK